MPKSEPPGGQPGDGSISDPTGFGNPVEQRHFLNANPTRISAIQNLLGTCKKTFLRTAMSDKPAESVAFYLGRICVEDFNEILLLSGNGHGVGAPKILRGMYERAVTSAYLFGHLDEGGRFLDFHKVHKYRAYNHSKKLGNFEPQLTAEVIRQINDEFEAVKTNYTEGIQNLQDFQQAYGEDRNSKD